MDVTHIVPGHLSYRVLTPLVLGELGFKTTADYFDEPESLDHVPEREVVFDAGLEPPATPKSKLSFKNMFFRKNAREERTAAALSAAVRSTAAEAKAQEEEDAREDAEAQTRPENAPVPGPEHVEKTDEDTSGSTAAVHPAEEQSTTTNVSAGIQDASVSTGSSTKPANAAQASPTPPSASSTEKAPGASLTEKPGAHPTTPNEPEAPTPVSREDRPKEPVPESTETDTRAVQDEPTLSGDTHEGLSSQSKVDAEAPPSTLPAPSSDQALPPPEPKPLDTPVPPAPSEDSLQASSPPDTAEASTTKSPPSSKPFSSVVAAAGSYGLSSEEAKRLASEFQGVSLGPSTALADENEWGSSSFSMPVSGSENKDADPSRNQQASRIPEWAAENPWG